MNVVAIAPCPICKADAAKPRVGALGEPKGVWCTQCGHAVGPGEPWSAAPSESEPPVYPWPGSVRPTIRPGPGLFTVATPLVSILSDPFGLVASVVYRPPGGGSGGGSGVKHANLTITPHPNATREADGSAPRALIANLHSALLDALARNAMGVSRPQGMTDEDFRVVLTECYNATKPNP